MCSEQRKEGGVDKLIIELGEGSIRRPRVKRANVYTEQYEQIMDLCEVTHLRQEDLMHRLLSFSLRRLELSTGEEGADG